MKKLFVILMVGFMMVSLSALDKTISWPSEIDGEINWRRAKDHDVRPKIGDAFVYMFNHQLQDYNWDGKINCVDYAIAFWTVYPDVELMEIHEDGVHHMFCMVMHMGKRYYIEPYIEYGNSWWFKDYWKVDPSKAKVVTKSYMLNYGIQLYKEYR